MIRRALLAFALLSAPLTLSGCGFTPVYAQKGLPGELANIDVITTDSRTGYFLRQNLVSGFNTLEGQKRYRLSVKLEEKRYDVGVGINDIAVRTEISTKVQYSLIEAATRKVLITGTFVDSTTYDANAQSPYAGVAAQKDGQQRAATAIGERIRSELVLFFHDKKAAPAS
ncbi:hypothetical protein [Asticcacaulis excentricus]|uniref:Lipoprotein n=1 Tax=Asticcacaulis excentricus (strain ATCC 15261 / DSM 4724 / KCTC 12464 / NCIMB 9791 / VKM B-1370 / CB 48) TaxID=573065 RepID=E8RNK5_ASTEC|nr:hypothetical protein [Asticcacaulis excentricus]ADU11836.1 Protein of unknown function DUF2159, secreted [Asticcacaulis excentricus CB 48]